MDLRNVVDVSSFLHCEATGDSEADSDLNMGAVSTDMDVAEDDAQSCSCDLSDCARVIEFDHFDDDDGDDLEYVHDDDDDDDDYDDDDEEEEEEVINQYWAGDDKVAPPSKAPGLVTCTAAAGQRKKSRGCIDPTKELMNEMDRNKLFWETCLAS
uniref:Uncharacterized protein n=1 Tax=Davidia involucrata TaxID=16924 RepID=A0A5B6YUN0_DAVIN